jgi:phage baseplate assembly protein gpV
MFYDLASVFAHQIHTAESEATRVYEAVIALVTDNKDPSKLGRVKVKVPILSDSDTTWWAPIVMLGAGKNRGWFFIPEIDDEVLDKNPGGNPRRVVKSRAGSKITFDDDKMQIIIEDGGGKGRITFDSNNNKIIIEALEGDVCFQSPQGDMKIVAKSAELKATQNLEIHAGSEMAWGTDASAKINGGSSVTMSGAKVNLNCGVAQAPQAPQATPKDVDDPYGS